MPTTTSNPEQPAKPENIGFIGRIPIRNIWLLMLYASGLLREREFSYVDKEEVSDKIPDLVAQLLCRRVEQRLLKQLSCGYRERQGVLNRVRGRIDLLKTTTHQLLARGQVACRYEELTINTPRNRFVRAALESIAALVSDQKLRKRCRKLAVRLLQLGVIGKKPERLNAGFDRFSYFDLQDRPMVAAAKLAFDLCIPSERQGKYLLTTPERKIEWLRKLYEKAIGGFYSAVFFGHDWTVSAGKYLQWPIEDKSKGIDKVFPSMKTDVMLEDREHGRRIIIDTKFNQLLVPGWHREETIRNGYIYQIYAYLRSQEGRRNDSLADVAEGVLLHPAVGCRIDEWVRLSSHNIRFKTIDLGASSADIRKELFEAVDPIQKLQQRRPEQ